MIPQPYITHWATTHPWPTADQVEQDLLLAQAICEIAADPLLGEELVLRGGTAFHKLYLEKPLRYSEDLDFVRTSAGGIGDIAKSLTSLGRELGYEVRTEMSRYPKVFWRYTSDSGSRGRIKIEMDTYERSPRFSLTSRRLAVVSPWCEYDQEVPSFEAEELCATKLRALYQRSKGRDLFDLWIALTKLELDAERILEAFSVYRPDGVTARMAEANLTKKLEDWDFRHDCDQLIAGGAESLGYNIDDAAELVIELIRGR